MTEQDKQNTEPERLAPTPRRVEWAGPEGWVVWADEDGVHLRAPQGQCLEMPDVRRLFSLWTDASAAVLRAHIPAPLPPTREQIREMGLREEYVKRRAIRAITAEFGDDPTPF